MVNDMACSYSGDRDEALIAYLYPEGDGDAARGEFDAHLATCARCRRELDALRGVRRQLASWSPPEMSFGFSPATSPRPPATHTWWHEIPAWAQVAAALLVLGVSAAIANLEVRYDANGVSVRTGWSGPSTTTAPSVAQASAGATPWRAELTALEQQLRSEIRAVHGAGPGGLATTTAPSGATVSAAAGEAAVLRRVRALLDESEKRQQRELALRVGEVLRDVDAARQADLRKIDRSLNGVQNSLGVEVLKQRESLNMLMRVSQRQ